MDEMNMQQDKSEFIFMLVTGKLPRILILDDCVTALSGGEKF